MYKTYKQTDKQKTKGFCKRAAVCLGRVVFPPITFLTSWRGVQAGEKGFWERHCLYRGCRSTFTCCRWLPWEEGGRRSEMASTSRGMRRKETSPDVDVGASGAPRGEGYELQCCHTQESQLWAQEFLTQGQPAQHSPNGGTSLTRARGFCMYLGYMVARNFTPLLHTLSSFAGASESAHTLSLAWGSWQSTLCPLWSGKTCRISSSHCWTPSGFFLQHRLQWRSLV